MAEHPGRWRLTTGNHDETLTCEMVPKADGTLLKSRAGMGLTPGPNFISERHDARVTPSYMKR